MFEIIFLVVICLYFIQSVILLTGANKKFIKVKDNQLKNISVIVAARNEEKNILPCMESLNKLIYPAEKIEIIIVNDNSEDFTLRIIEEYISDKPKFRCMNTKKQIGNLKGKTNALANALEAAKGEIILTTDADCIVSPLWAKTLASYYDENVAMVFGYTTQTAEDNFSGMQMLDFIYLLTVAAGAMNYNVPLSCIGNNMSYRRSVYKEVGGYESIPFSITEDFTLLHTIFRLKKYKVIYPLDKDALVVSKPCENVKALYWQKKRWGVGGLDSELPGFFVMGTGFFANLGVLIFPLFYSPSVLYIAVFKIAADLFFLYPVLKKLGLSEKLKYFIAFQIYYIIYVLGLPVSVLLSKKVIWKGRKY